LLVTVNNRLIFEIEIATYQVCRPSSLTADYLCIKITEHNMQHLLLLRVCLFEL